MNAKVKYDKERNVITVTGGTKENPIRIADVKTAWVRADGPLTEDGLLLIPKNCTLDIRERIPLSELDSGKPDVFLKISDLK